MTLTPDDLNRVEDLIAAKLDLMSAFRDLPDADRESIARDIEGFIYGRQPSQEKPKNFYTPRVTVAGADINADSNAVDKGHHGPTLPRWIDFVGATGYLDSADAQIAHIQMAGGGADCLFDKLVSGCFSTLTGFTEGKTFTTLSGCTFKGYSTIGGALNAIEADTSVSDKDWVVAICAGDYVENVIWPNVSTAYTQSITLMGTGGVSRDTGGRVRILPTSGAAITVDGGTPVTPMHLYNMTIGRVGGGNTSINQTGGNNLEGNWSNVNFICDLNFDPEGVYASQCKFAAITTLLVQAPEDLVFDACEFSGVVDLSLSIITNVVFNGCLFTTSAKILIGAFHDLNITANRFACTIDAIKFSAAITAADAYGLTIAGNTFTGAPTTGNAMINLQRTGGVNPIATVNITGNTFSGRFGAASRSSTTAWIKVAGKVGSVMQGVNISGNAFGMLEDGGDGTIEAANGFSVIADYVRLSQFGPNTPVKAMYSLTNMSVGSDASRINAVQWVTAAPTHTAMEGDFAFDTSANTLYVNTNGATTWAVVGTSGGGGSAPVGEPFVTIGNTAGLSAERALTAGNGVGFTDDGAGITATLKLVPLTADWVQSGVFGIWTAGSGRVGSSSAPTNTTAGDLTATRLIVPNAAIIHSAISQLGGPVVIPVQGALRFSDTDNSHYTGFKAHGTTTASVEYTWPPADGTSGYQLTTDGAGVLSWAAAGSGGGGSITVQEEDGAPIDAAVTIIRVPNGSMVDNGVGDVSLQQVHELTFYSPDAATGDLQPYIPIRFNGSGATARSVNIAARQWGYGTFVADVYKATDATPTYSFASILSTPITVDAGAISFGGLEYATITPGVIGTSALADGDVIQQLYTSSNGANGVTVELTVTAP